MKKPEYRKGYTNISNDLMDNICKLPLNGTDIKVILCIFRYTAGVGRKSCKLSGSSIAKWGNCDLRAVKRALKKLQENKIIIRVNPNIKGKAAEIMINKDYKQWSINKDIQEYYYCFSFDEWSHDLYSITEMSRKEAILTAIDNGVRLYLVKYRKGKQQGNKKRIATKNMA